MSGNRSFNKNEYLIADTHFGHSRVIEFEKRPFENVEEMDEEIIKSWNSVVHKKDKVWHLGDCSFYGKEKTKSIISRLNGYKILVMGNHDMRKGVSWWRDVGFNEVYRYPFIRNGIIFSHMIECHNDYYNIHGHLHSNINKKHYPFDRLNCVSLENYDYKPVSIWTILNKWGLNHYGEKVNEDG